MVHPTTLQLRKRSTSGKSIWRNTARSALLLLVAVGFVFLATVCWLNASSWVTTATSSSLRLSPRKSYYPPYSQRPNAIVYMCQKHDEIYLRDSLPLLTKSLDLLFQNYLLLNEQYKTVNVFLFHTGDFVSEDLDRLESRYPVEMRGTLRLVNLNPDNQGSPYWQLPPWLAATNKNLQQHWGLPEFNMGYRHMIRWYALQLYAYFDEVNREVGTRYRYIMRMDEESFFHSPIDYDIFRFMATHNYKYAFRMCSYEMNAIKQQFANYTIQAQQQWGSRWNRKRTFDGGNCGFYNNWFIVDLQRFLQPDIQHMLQWFDREGFMYRDRMNDLVIQSAAVYAFLETNEIHRFLDWSYEHFTIDKVTQCPIWGSIQAGYKDANGSQLVESFVADLASRTNCTIERNRVKRRVPPLHISLDHASDLSPTYNHLSPEMAANLVLPSVKAGLIDLPGRGKEKSG